jgi:hypothetical protein
MSRRRAANRRELLLPLGMPDRHQTGITFDPCAPIDPTGMLAGEAGEPAETWPRHATHCCPAKQTSQPTKESILALIAGKHVLARLIFQRIRPRTHSGMLNEQSCSPHELQRLHAAIASPYITTPLVNCADPTRTPTPEIETLFTKLARRQLRKRTAEETR